MQRAIVAACGILLSMTLAFSFGPTGGGSTANMLTIYDQNSGCNGHGQLPLIANGGTASGRTPTATALTPGEKTFIQFVIGDSISANSGASAYVPTNTAKNQNLNPYDGLNYQYKDPVLGASDGPGSYPARIADKLINAGKFARVITYDPSIGGTCSQDWATAGSFNHRARVGCLMARGLSWPISGTGDSGNWRMGFIYALGTNDNARGVDDPAHPVSPAAFTANAQSFFQSMRDYGCSGDVFVAKSTMNLNAVNIGLQGAQAGLVNNPAGIYVGADVDSLGGANRQGDGTHLSDAGNDANATLWSNIFIAHY